MGRSKGRTLFRRLAKVYRVGQGNDGEWSRRATRRSRRRQHATSIRSSPRTKRAIRRTPQAEVVLGVDESSGGGDGFEKKMTVPVENVEAVSPPHMLLAN